MIQHIFKIIWTERRTNIWILLELILVFSILWFCADFLFFMGKRFIEPKGFNIEHTYKIEIGMKNAGLETASSDSVYKEVLENSTWTIYDRVKHYTGIESVSFSQSAFPYSGSYSSNTYMVDTVSQGAQSKWVTSGFFDVFRIPVLQGAVFTPNQLIAEDVVMISAQRDNTFGKREVTDVKEIETNWGPKTLKSKVVAVVGKAKRSDYDDYEAIIYKPLREDNTTWSGFAVLPMELCVRVKPDADKDFVERFTKEMRDQLEVGPYFLINIVPIESFRQNYMSFTGINSRLKSVFSISAFLIINIFLGIIGTFWFRIQTRRSEIGLRVALGASKNKVRNMFVGETLLLLFVASTIATIICVNITMVDVLKDIGMPTIDRNDNEIGISQYFINYAVTFISLALIASMAVWYPAKKASDIQPAEALRSE